MLKIRNIALSLLILFCVNAKLDAQVITNEGREFWFAFPHVMDSTNARFWVNITSKYSATGTVSIPGTGFSQNFSVSPNQIARINFNSADAHISGSRVLRNKAIRISATANVVAYGVSYRQVRHEATLILPNRALGTSYRAMTYKSENKSNRLWRSEFVVVAAGDTAKVEIAYTDSVRNGGGPYKLDTVSIPPNQVYQAQAARVSDDLAGSHIRSLNGKKFAVYAGNEWSTVICSPNSDPLFEVMYPTNTWGQSFLAIPTWSVNKDYIKVIAHEDSTNIYRNGVFMSNIDAGEFWDDTIQSTRYYAADKPIQIGQFLVTGQNFCSANSQTDPSMVMLNATEQMYLDTVTFFAVDTNQIDSHFVSIITRTNDTDKIFLDSVRIRDFRVFPTAQAYSYRFVTISRGRHTLETTGCGFQAYSMGIGRAVSYAYAAGVTLLDLENSISFKNFYTGTDTICQGDTVQFQTVIKGDPISFRWDFGDGSTDTVRNPIHSYTQTGRYQVTTEIVYQCLTDTLIDTIEVPPPPIIDLGPDTSICNRDTLEFSVNTRVFRALWNTGSTASRLQIFQPDTYSVKVYNFCGADRDTVVIDTLYPDTVNLGIDTLMCYGDSLEYDLRTLNNTQYLWQDGSTSPFRTIDSTGLYWVELRNICGLISDTIDVEFERTPVVDFGPDTSLCQGAIIFLNAINSRARYLWQDGSRLGGKNVLAPGGLYWAQASNLCGSDRDSIYVHYDYPLNLNLGPDSILCLGDQILLDPGNTGTSSIRWQNGSPDSTYLAVSQGLYWIRATNLCGVYIDSIRFEDSNDPSIGLPDDSILCFGNPVNLAVAFPNSSYAWSTGQTDSNITVNQSGTYAVSVTNICGTDIDSVSILYDEPIQIDFGPDTNLCNADTLYLDARITTRGYHIWNNGWLGDEFTVRRTGYYRVEISNACGVFGDEIRVQYEYTPEVDFLDDTVLCKGDYMYAKAPQLLNATYQWQDGSTWDRFFVNEAGTYWLEASNRCGKDLDRFNVRYQDRPIVDLGGDQILCPGESLLLDVSRENFNYRFLWQDGSTHSAMEASEEGVFKVMVTDQYGCVSIDSMEVLECVESLYIPNSFSPNLDGKNEYWAVKGERLRNFKISVHNRWGQLVFQADKLNFKWDGRNGESLCPVGTYVYLIQYTDLENQPQRLTGHLHLIR